MGANERPQPARRFEIKRGGDHLAPGSLCGGNVPLASFSGLGADHATRTGRRG